MLLRLFCQSPELAPSCKMPCRQFTAKPVICSSEHLREVEACGRSRAQLIKRASKAPHFSDPAIKARPRGYKAVSRGAFPLRKWKPFRSIQLTSKPRVMTKPKTEPIPPRDIPIEEHRENIKSEGEQLRSAIHAATAVASRSETAAAAEREAKEKLAQHEPTVGCPTLDFESSGVNRYVGASSNPFGFAAS
jgi:hypothetical protein